MTATCPLCNAASDVATERILVERLVKMYMQLLDIDVSEEFGLLDSINYIRCNECDLGYFTPPVSGSEHFYNKLQAFDWYYMDEKNEFDFARRFVKQSDDVLEIGCGKGAFAKLINVRSYLGLEFSKKAQHIAADNGIRVVNESIQNHSVSNVQAYDIVCSFQVLEHIVDVRSFIESAMVCLKPGGHIIFSTPSIDSFGAFAPNHILDMPPHHLTRWSDRSYINLSNLFNLELIELWHEPLQHIHKEFFVQTMLTNAIIKLFRQKNFVLNDSIAFKLVSHACSLPSKLFSRVLLDCFPIPRGISVTAVFRKPFGG